MKMPYDPPAHVAAELARWLADRPAYNDRRMPPEARSQHLVADSRALAAKIWAEAFHAGAAWSQSITTQRFLVVTEAERAAWLAREQRLQGPDTAVLFPQTPTNTEVAYDTCDCDVPPGAWHLHPEGQPDTTVEVENNRIKIVNAKGEVTRYLAVPNTDPIRMVANPPPIPNGDTVIASEERCVAGLAEGGFELNWRDVEGRP